MPSQMNCGIEALSKLGNLKNISAFSIVHLARDNGMNLHVFKVIDNKDLVRVIRPAIFHQKDHFVYVKADEPMPVGEYTGYVIGSTVLGRVISLAEAKFITGGKKGGAARSIVPAILGAIATVIAGPVGGAIVGGLSNIGMDQYAKSNHPEQLGEPGHVGDILGAGALGAAEGYGAGQIATGAIQGASASAPGVISKGWGAARGAASTVGIGTNPAVQASNLGGQVSAFNGGTSSALASNTGNAFNAASNAANATSLNGAGALAGGAPAMSLPNGGVGDVSGNQLSNVGNFTPQSFTPSANFDISSAKTLFTPQTNQTLFGSANNLLSKTGGITTATNAVNGVTGGGLFGNSNLSNAATIAGAAGVFGSQAPAYNGASPTQNYSAVQQYMGPDALKSATTDQIQQYVSTPIQDLQKQFTANNQRTLDTINTSYDNQKQNLVHAYAQAGQNLSNSSELQDKVSQLEQKRTNDLTLANQELTDHALSQAIQVKQQALSQGMQQGQWNQSLAMQLAQLTGDQQNLQYAIANNDYQSFQQIMGKLMTMGIPQTVSLSK